MKHKIEIFGGSGQHGSDLIKNRRVFDGINIETFPEKHKNDSQETKAIIIPISETQQLINSIIECGQNENIINFSGIMSTTPDSIRGNPGVENFHFLFGPKATSNLKCVIAFEDTLSPLASKIINNSKKNSIKIIESSIEGHDKKMAIIQGLNHLVRQLLVNSNIKTNLPQISTTSQTIQDMIQLNPHMNSIMQELNVLLLNDKINLSEFFNQLIEENLNETDIKNFSTPAFSDTLTFMRGNKVVLESDDIHKYLKKNNFS